MSMFDQAMARYANPLLQQQHGEACVFKPKEGDQVPITAIIERFGLDVSAAARGRVTTPEIFAQISRADVAAINFGGDKLACKKNKTDASATDMTISSLISQDGNFWRVRLNG